MKTLTCLRDLENYGIIPLTGEADALSFRILCDLTRTGVEVVRECFGMPAPELICGDEPHGRKVHQFAEPWNSATKGSPHVASIMLTNDMWHSLGIIALFHIDKCHTVLSCTRGQHCQHPVLYGFAGVEEFERAEYDFDKDPIVMTKPPRFNCTHGWIEWSPELHGKIDRMYYTGSGPHQGTRNTHQMSGRTT